jgi:hypothetical protein
MPKAVALRRDPPQGIMPLRTGPAGRRLFDAKPRLRELREAGSRLTPDVIEVRDPFRLAPRSLGVAPERPIPAVAFRRCDAGTFADSRIGWVAA